MKLKLPNTFRNYSRFSEKESLEINGIKYDILKIEINHPNLIIHLEEVTTVV